MENNQFNTINLGNNLGGVTPPVYGGSVTKQPINTEVKNTEENLNVEVQESVEKTTEVSEKSPIVLENEIILPTVLLREMTAQARKVGISNNERPVTCILNIMIDENGVAMRASGGVDNPDFICVDKTYISKTKLYTSVDISLFGDYLNAEKNDMLKLDFVEAEGTLYITSKSGMRKFPIRVDESTHEQVIHELKFPFAYEEMLEVNYDRFRGLIDLSSSARELANKVEAYQFLQGLYLGEELVVASDGNVMVIQPNTTEFNKIFLINNKMCGVISSIKFNPDTFRVGITEENGFVSGITLSDGRTTICGPLSFEENYPIEAAKKFWTATGFTQSISVNTKDLIDVLKSIIPFIPSAGDYTDKLSIKINGNILDIECLDGTAKENFVIVNNTNYLTRSPLLLPASKLYKVLQAIQSSTFDILIDPNADNCVCLKYDNVKNIVTTVND